MLDNTSMFILIRIRVMYLLRVDFTAHRTGEHPKPWRGPPWFGSSLNIHLKAFFSYIPDATYPPVRRITSTNTHTTKKP